jgi:hypothetical protein
MMDRKNLGCFSNYCNYYHNSHFNLCLVSITYFHSSITLCVTDPPDHLPRLGFYVKTVNSVTLVSMTIAENRFRFQYGSERTNS